jgi:hypothetical protein
MNPYLFVYITTFQALKAGHLQKQATCNQVLTLNTGFTMQVPP